LQKIIVLYYYYSGLVVRDDLVVTLYRTGLIKSKKKKKQYNIIGVPRVYYILLFIIINVLHGTRVAYIPTYLRYVIFDKKLINKNCIYTRSPIQLSSIMTLCIITEY